ncbi:MAG: hypothetical protein WB643_10600 [Candidatus Bathyarchaeia archaeon]
MENVYREKSGVNVSHKMSWLTFKHLTVFLPALIILVLAIGSAYAQYNAPLLTISPTTMQLSDTVNFNWGCPSAMAVYLPSIPSSSHSSGGGGYVTLLFGYAQITVTRVQEYPQSIPPFVGPQLPMLSGTLPYVAPTSGTFTVILRCYYDGRAIGLGEVQGGKAGGQFIVTPPSNPGTTTTTTSTETPATITSSQVSTTTPTTSEVTSSQEITPTQVIENACDPAVTIIAIAMIVILTIIIIVILRRWIVGLFGGLGTLLILAVIIGILVGLILMLVIVNICNPPMTIVLAIIAIIVILLILRRRIFGPPPPPPPGGNVTGNATLTGRNGGQTQLTGGNLNQVGPGTTVTTGGNSFVRVPTPQGSDSQSVIGQNSSLGWLDTALRTPIPWLRFPGLSQIYNAGSVLLRLDFGKLLIHWVESAASQEAVVALPAGLIGAATSAAMGRWLARVKGTMLLVEATKDGTAAAVTVLEEEGVEGSVELWRSDDLNKIIEVHPGERVILKAGRRPAKTKIKMAKGLAQQIQDPFGILHKYWTLPPLSDETDAALEAITDAP